MFRKLYGVIVGMLLTVNAVAQDVSMADVMRSNGKIYTVVAVLVLLFLGIIIFLVFLEKKLNRLEKEIYQLSDSEKLV